MSKNKAIIIAGLILGLVTMVALTSPVRVYGDECLIVRITGVEGANRMGTIGLAPERLAVHKGDCVVWVNLSPSPDVTIKFEDAKKCLEATEAPTGFNYDHVKGCYVTGMIRKGGTSSLRFINPGTYEYSITATPLMTVVAKGKIVVE